MICGMIRPVLRRLGVLGRLFIILLIKVHHINVYLCYSVFFLRSPQ